MRSIAVGRGPATDIAPLADVLPSMQRPTWSPLSAEQLQGTLSLQPGKFALTEVRWH